MSTLPKITRRTFTMAVASAAAGGAGIAAAQDFPTKPIRIILSLGAGSTSDITARLIAAEASKRLKTPIIVENRPGAGTRLASEAVVRSAPDGYTLLGSGASLPSHKVVFKSLTYDPMKDLRPVTISVDNIFVVVVDAKLPVKTLREFVDYAKANPDKLNYGSLGKNSVMMGIENFKERAGISMTEIAYKSGAELNTALISGQIHFANNPVTVIKPFLDDGRMRALAVIGPKRLALLPNVPTVAEAGFPYYINPGWTGFWAPAQTPDAVVNILYREFAATLNDPAVAAQIERLGAIVMATPPQEMLKRMQEEEQLWIRVAKAIKLESE